MSTAPKRQPIPFGKYLLLDRINIGGMAEVWRAKTFGAGGFERLVAIKRILPNIAEDEEFITMFIDEAKITVQLNHANIGQIYELANVSNSYFIAMEYISGKDLRAVFDRCRKRGEPAPIPLTCYVIARCCEGLDYAHRCKDRQGRDMGVVHRDVSPQNALVSYDGEVKIIDFGIAKAAGKATKTQAGILKGKFGYMSPEQIRGLPIDRRSDVFAVGVCLYEMLTGERLFVGDSDFSVLEKVRKVEVLPPSHFNRRIPEALEKIVMKALAKEVDDRYQYASELGDDLQRFLVTSDTVFGRKDLAAFMKATFAEEVDKEKQRLQEYAEIAQPDGMQAADLGFANAPSIPTAKAIPTHANGPADTARNPVLSVGPKLSAAPAVSTREKEEHGSTVLIGDDTMPPPKRPAEVPSSRALTGSPFSGGTADFEVPTDPGRPGAPPTPPPMRSMGGNIPNIDPAAMAHTVASSPHGSLRSGPSGVLRMEPPPQPIPAARPSLGSGIRQPSAVALPPVSSPSGIGLPKTSSQPYVPRMAPPEAIGAASVADEASQPSRRGLLVGVAGAVVLGLVGAGYVATSRKGLLMLDLPVKVGGKARVNVNGKDLTEADGSLIRDWPQIREVPAGKVTVMIVAPGYETFTEVVEVKEGNEYTPLPKKLKEQKPDAPAPAPDIAPPPTAPP